MHFGGSPVRDEGLWWVSGSGWVSRSGWAMLRYSTRSGWSMLRYSTRSGWSMLRYSTRSGWNICKIEKPSRFQSFSDLDGGNATHSLVWLPRDENIVILAIEHDADVSC